MYSSRGSNAYGQQSYGAQSGFGQNAGSAFSGTSVGGPDGNSQHSMVSRHSTLVSGSQDADVAVAYRTQASNAALYGGQYSSVYGSTSLNSGQQASVISSKAAGPSTLEGRSGYPSALAGSPKFTSGDYLSSNHGYGHKADQLLSEKIPDYPSIERRQYGERQSAYLGRDLQSEPGGRFTDSAGFSHQHEKDLYDRLEQASLLRQEQMLKAQSLQAAASLDGGARQADYLAARGAAIRNSNQELLSYGGRIDADPRTLSMRSGSSYSGQPTPSILGAVPRSVEELMYAQSSSNPGYGVSLPPGRDYATGKGVHMKSLESDYPTSLLSRGGYSRIDDPKDDRSKYALELELREEERRREKLREREREREKDRQRERERERERERDRERQRERERRDRDRERERKRGLEAKRDRTPSKVTKDLRGASLTKDSKSAQLESPRLEAAHRRPSPVKEKRRDYDCKVHSSSIVDIERDYLSIDKRYPRLVISPEFCKVVVNWPKENLKLSIHTAVSFEHDFIEENIAEKKQSSATLTEETLKSKEGSTVWVAKMILMSGLSQKALEDLSSERSFDDRVPHICNILRFAFLKKEHSFLAIGGPWDAVDGGDPSVDDSSLVQTVMRHANDVTQLDLKNCQNWNRFLEIHYDRVGKDGLFSHKEVTVLFVPDLSQCLPSLDAWRDQWLAHMKTITERERLLSLKKEKSREKREVSKGKEIDTPKDIKGIQKTGKKKEPITPGKSTGSNNKKAKDGNELKGSAADKSGEKELNVKKINGVEVGKENTNVEKKEEIATATSQASGSANSGKKKIVKRIVKQKVTAKKDGTSTTADDQNGEQLVEKNAVELEEKSEAPGKDVASSAEPKSAKTIIRKKVTKKVLVGNKAKIEEGLEPKVKSEGELATPDPKPQINLEENSPAVVKTPGVKKTIKRKIIKRVPKRKATDSNPGEGASEKKNYADKNENAVSLVNKELSGEQIVGSEKQVNQIEKSEIKSVPKSSPKTLTVDKQDNISNSSKIGTKAEEKSILEPKVEAEPVKEKDILKGNQNTKKEKDKVTVKAEKDKKDAEGKEEVPKSKSGKEVKEQKKLEPPRPGFILQTRGNKDSKLRSLSLSLDSLLDYTDKDLEESTFELSLFAESFYEMLQFQMGCRLLDFLQKLRIKFVTKRNIRKRQREDTVEKEIDKTPSKRPKTIGLPVKTNELPVKNRKSSSENIGSALKDDEKDAGKEKQASVADAEEKKEATIVDPEEEKEDSVADAEEEKVEDESEVDEDPEEDPEEDEDMQDASPQHNLSNENNGEENVDTDLDPEMVLENKNEKTEESSKKTDEKSEYKEKPKTDVDRSKEKSKSDAETKKESPVVAEVVDKELLQAFRFFDRNRVGYIRVEDMRLILHSLKKFLAHRDVKELVQSALLESNTGRDDRILYKKLVRMTDI